ncbi:MAG: hypothetical protein ABIB41_01615 [Nitrospirota bacterium]
MDMISAIIEATKTNYRLAKLLENVQEYAQLYLLAKQRQKGCDGFGEVTNLKEEFSEVTSEMLDYYRKKNSIADNIVYDIDYIAEELLKTKKL